MPRVVADSDDDSDVSIVSPPKKDKSSKKAVAIVPPPNVPEPDPVLNLDFDQFLSPTQRLSTYDGATDSFDNTQEQPHNSSHDRFLHDYAVANHLDSSTNGVPTESTMSGKSKSKKRAHEEQSSKPAKEVANKKQKQYASSANAELLGDYHNLIGNATSFETMQTDSAKNTVQPSNLMLSTTNETTPLGVNLVPSNPSLPQLTDTSTGSSRPRLPATAQSSFYGNMMLHGTTTNSSIGAHQSFNLDPQSLGMGFDEINPFGSPSQADLGVGNEGTSSLNEMYKIGTARSDDVTSSFLQNIPDIDVPPAQPSASPEYSPLSVRAEVETKVDKFTLDHSAEPAKKEKKKRGRRSRTSMANDDEDELQAEDPNMRGLRAGTVDSVSNMSETSNATQAGKKGKKAKKINTEMQAKKLPSSELGLDNKEVIGLSPERYKPRPSRRRGRAEPDPVAEVADFIAKNDNSAHEADTIQGDADEPKTEGKKAKKSKKTNEVVVEDDEEAVQVANMGNKISIEIPALPKPEIVETLPPPVAEPKKRGRKKKKVEEEPKIEEAAIEERPALVEKDANITVASRTTRVIEDEDEEEKLPVETIAPNQNDVQTDQENVKVEISETKPSIVKTETPVKPKLESTTTPLSQLLNKPRIGLSKKRAIPSLLTKINRNKEAPKHIIHKEKMNKRKLEEMEQERIAREEAEAEGREYVPLDIIRDKDGRLVEWDF